MVDPSTVGSLGKCFGILSTFSPQRPSLTAREIAELTGLDRTTTHRFLKSLAALQIVEHDSKTHRYSLGVRLLQYASAILDSMDVRRAALPHMFGGIEIEDNAILQLAVRAPGTEAIIVERVWNTNSPITSLITSIPALGRNIPIEASVGGRVILAYLSPEDRQEILDHLAAHGSSRGEPVDVKELEDRLELIRSRGFDVSDHRLYAKIFAVAAPVLGPQSVASGSLIVSIEATDALDDFTSRWIPRLTELSARVSHSLGFLPNMSY